MIDNQRLFVKSFVKTIFFCPICDINDNSKDWSFFFCSMKSFIELIKSKRLCITVNIVIMTELKHFFHIFDWAYYATNSLNLISDHIINIDFELSCWWWKTKHNINSSWGSQSLKAFVNLLIVQEKSIYNQVIFSLVRF